MYACMSTPYQFNLNKAPSVTAVVSKKYLLFRLHSNTFKLFILKLEIIRCTSCRMLAIGTDMCFEKKNGSERQLNK